MNSNITYISRLINRLEALQDRFIRVLRASQLDGYVPQSNPLSSVFGDQPPRRQIKYRWLKAPVEVEREQNQIHRDFEVWHSDFIALFPNATQDESNRLKALYLEMDSWLKNRHSGAVPNSTLNAEKAFRETCLKLVAFLGQAQSMSKNAPVYIIDTSALIDYPDIESMAVELDIHNADFVIPTTTISELDNLKTGKRNEEFRSKLTAAIKYINDLTSRGDVLEGISGAHGLKIKMLAKEPDFSQLPNWLDPSNKDDRIVASAIELQRLSPASTITIVANDINMQNKAKLASINVLHSPTPKT